MRTRKIKISNLRVAFEGKGKSQKEVWQKTGISPTALSRLVTGGLFRTTAYWIVEALAEELQTSPDKILEPKNARKT